MSKLKLTMKVSMLQNHNWRWIPTNGSEGFELDFMAAKGGELRRFDNDQAIPNDMIIGSEFTEAKFLGNLIVGRFSDGFSLDLANLSRTQEFINIGVTVFAGLRAINFLAKNAKISWFNRTIAKGKNYELVKFSFSSNDAKIDYRNTNGKALSF
jgi:hypothetical protein